jgi:hypothetical protein
MCGDRIGVYELLWLELVDGSLHRSSYLNLGDHPGHDPSRLWHLDCLIPDRPRSHGLRRGSRQTGGDAWLAVPAAALPQGDG